MYGTIKLIDMPNDRTHPNMSRGFAYIEYENSEDAEKAIKYMDGGMFCFFLLNSICSVSMYSVHIVT